MGEGHTHYGKGVEVRTQLVGISSFLMHGSQGLNYGCQSWQ